MVAPHKQRHEVEHAKMLMLQLAYYPKLPFTTAMKLSLGPSERNKRLLGIATEMPQPWSGAFDICEECIHALLGIQYDNEPEHVSYLACIAQF